MSILEITLFIALILLGYHLTGLSEIIIHSVVYHGKWRQLFDLPVIGRYFYTGYVAHWEVHHKGTYAINHITQYSSDACLEKNELLYRWPGFTFSLKNSDFGNNLNFWTALYHLSLLFMTPLPYVAIFTGVLLGPAFGLACLLPGLLYAVSSGLFHPWVHLSHQEMEDRAPWWVQRILSTQIGKNVRMDHYIHHSVSCNHNYNLLPGTRWLSLLTGTQKKPEAKHIKKMERIGLVPRNNPTPLKSMNFAKK